MTTLDERSSISGGSRTLVDSAETARAVTPAILAGRRCPEAADLPFWQEWSATKGLGRSSACHFGRVDGPGRGNAGIGCSVHGLIVIGRLRAGAAAGLPSALCASSTAKQRSSLFHGST